MHKPLAKKIACVKKDHDDATEDRKVRCHEKSDLCHEKHHGYGKYYARKCKKKFCNYHGLCHRNTKERNYYQAHRKHIQHTHCIIEEQRLRHVHFVKDAKRGTKKCSLSTREVKDLNMFVKDKINMIKEHNCNEQFQGAINILQQQEHPEYCEWYLF
eukprot:11583023-Ditylum_brightwellii.AAC.1